MKRFTKASVDYDRRTPSQIAMWPLIEKVQALLGPECTDKVMAINRDTGEYVLGDDWGEAYRAYRDRFAHPYPYIVRVDGSPALRM